MAVVLGWRQMKSNVQPRATEAYVHGLSVTKFWQWVVDSSIGQVQVLVIPMILPILPVCVSKVSRIGKRIARCWCEGKTENCSHEV